MSTGTNPTSPDDTASVCIDPNGGITVITFTNSRTDGGITT